jgi:hypothetical protein
VSAPDGVPLVVARWALGFHLVPCAARIEGVETMNSDTKTPRAFEVVAGTYWPSYLLGAAKEAGLAEYEARLEAEQIPTSKETWLTPEYQARMREEGAADVARSQAAIGLRATEQAVRDEIERHLNLPRFTAAGSA